MKRILIEWVYHDRAGNDGPGYREALEIIKHTVETMRPYLRTMQVQLDLREVRLTGDGIGLSPMVKINGKKMEDLLVAAPERMSCNAPGAALPGRESFCAGLQSQGREFTVSREMLVDALLKETARFGSCGCGCSPEDLSR
jgi:hypothetical protein